MNDVYIGNYIYKQDVYIRNLDSAVVSGLGFNAGRRAIESIKGWMIFHDI